jgi:hypothetical protein
MSGLLPPFRERLAWHDDGSIADGPIRYLLLRTDSLMQFFKRLDRDARLEALNAFAASLAENGRKSLQERMRRLNLSPAELYDDLTRSSGSQLGWGVWTYGRTGVRCFEVEVANSPFAHGFGPSDHPVCFPITGMLQAIGGLVLDASVRVKETSCAAVSGGSCHFKVACAD